MRRVLSGWWPIRAVGLLGLAIALAAFVPSRVAAQNTGFAYQGRLTEAGSAASGTFEMEFRLFDTAQAGTGTQQGATVSVPAVTATEGDFTVTLDFGVAVFDGSARFLEVSVKRADSPDPFSLLTPRQQVSTVPYALHSLQAGTAATALAVADGLAVRSLNNLRDDVTLEAGPNITITPNGQTLTIAATGGGGGEGGSLWSLNGADAYYRSGKVGIGTDSPKGALHVASGGLAITGNSSPYTGAAGPGVFLEASPTGGFLFAYDYSASASRNLLLNSPGGNVGIGTTTPASKLTVLTTSRFNAYGIEHTDGTVRLSTFLDGTGGWLGTRTSHDLNFYVNDDVPSLAIQANGNVVVTPNGGAGGYGRTVFGTPNGESGMTIIGGNRADVRFNGSTLKLVAGPGTGPPPSEYGIAISTAGNVGIGTTSPGQKLDVAGNVNVAGSVLVSATTTTCALEITGGCDLAEPFAMKESDIEKGSVVVIDDEHPGRLKRSSQAYDTRVAGVVSGANGINSGIRLRQAGVLEGGEDVALTGRVYVRADASTGAIKPGDLLTTSDVPGHAMKATVHEKAQGAILGKAMSRLEKGQGMVLVLVSLQ